MRRTVQCDAVHLLAGPDKIERVADDPVARAAAEDQRRSHLCAGSIGRASRRHCTEGAPGSLAAENLPAVHRSSSFVSHKVHRTAVPILDPDRTTIVISVVVRPPSFVEFGYTLSDSERILLFLG